MSGVLTIKLATYSFPPAYLMPCIASFGMRLQWCTLELAAHYQAFLAIGISGFHNMVIRYFHWSEVAIKVKNNHGNHIHTIAGLTSGRTRIPPREYCIGCGVYRGLKCLSSLRTTWSVVSGLFSQHLIDIQLWLLVMIGTVSNLINCLAAYTSSYFLAPGPTPISWISALTHPPLIFTPVPFLFSLSFL
jgi:hypothetical protein